LGSDLSEKARRILEGLLAGRSLNDLAPAGSAERAEVEAHLIEALGSDGRGGGAATKAAAGRLPAKTPSAKKSPAKRAPARKAVTRDPAPVPATRPVPGRAIAYSDGASRGNPGPAAYGIRILTADEVELFEEGKCIGRATNNVAEYRGVIAVLERAKELGIAELELRLDSELIVKQIEGAYRVKQPALQDLKAQVDRLLRGFRYVKVLHVRRERNKEADSLANAALDAA
jgi:ribonuclease HI